MLRRLGGSVAPEAPLVATFLVKNALGLEAVGLLSRSARGWSHRYRNDAFESKNQASVGTILGSLCQETTNHLKCRLRQEHTPNMGNDDDRLDEWEQAVLQNVQCVGWCQQHCRNEPPRTRAMGKANRGTTCWE